VPKPCSRTEAKTCGAGGDATEAGSSNARGLTLELSGAEGVRLNELLALTAGPNFFLILRVRQAWMACDHLQRSCHFQSPLMPMQEGKAEP